MFTAGRYAQLFSDKNASFATKYDACNQYLIRQSLELRMPLDVMVI